MSENTVPQLMPSPMSILASRLKANDWMVRQAVEGLADEEWRQPIAGANPMLWVLGHIVAYRRRMMEAAGLEADAPDDEALFTRGSSGEPPTHVAPDSLLERLADYSRRLVEKLAGMSEEEAAEKTEIVTPDRSPDRIRVLFFFYFHETYHVGQLGLLRRQLGHDRIV